MAAKELCPCQDPDTDTWNDAVVADEEAASSHDTISNDNTNWFHQNWFYIICAVVVLLIIIIITAVILFKLKKKKQIETQQLQITKMTNNISEETSKDDEDSLEEIEYNQTAKNDQDNNHDLKISIR